MAKRKDDDEGFFTVKDVCGLFGISDVTLARWEKEVPGFPAPARIGRRKYYPKSEIFDFAETTRKKVA